MHPSARCWQNRDKLTAIVTPRVTTTCTQTRFLPLSTLSGLTNASKHIHRRFFARYVPQRHDPCTSFHSKLPTTLTTLVAQILPHRPLRLTEYDTLSSRQHRPPLQQPIHLILCHIDGASL